MGHPCATHVLHDSVGSARTGRPVPGRPAGYCPSCDGCDEEKRPSPVKTGSLLSFPEREGRPSVWTVDRFVHRPYDSLLPFWWWVLAPTVRVTPSLQGREACEPPTRKRVLSPFQGDTIFPPFPQAWETPVCRLRRGGHKCHKKGCNFPHNYDKI